MKVSISWNSSNPNTVYAVLKRKLGREPQQHELHAEVQRIFDEAMQERTEHVGLLHYGKR